MRFNADGYEHVEAFLFAKTAPFAWEREWRYIGTDEARTHKPITHSALRAIVLGSRMDANLRDEVVRLACLWKPAVELFVEAANGSGNLRLVPFARATVSNRGRIIPPIQERGRGEPLKPSSGSDITRLLDYLATVSPVHRRQELDTRVEGLAAELDAALRSKRTRESAARAATALKKAADVLRELVEPDGSVIAGYGDVAVVLYEFVYAGAIATGFLGELDDRFPP